MASHSWIIYILQGIESENAGATDPAFSFEEEKKEERNRLDGYHTRSWQALLDGCSMVTLRMLYYCESHLPQTISRNPLTGAGAAKCAK
jgi:hypothetical protein